MMNSDRACPVIGPPPHTPEWHTFRASGIGASEAAAACGLSPFATPLHIYARKTGEIGPIEDNDAMRLGRKLEPIVVSEFAERTGREIAQANCPVMRHGEHVFMLATPDAIVRDDELLECKTTTWRTGLRAEDEDTDNIPESWLLQVQQQLAVTGFDVGHLAALIDGRVLRTFRVDRNDNLIALMVSAEEELWQRIVNRDPPEPTWEHPRTPELIREMHGLTTGKTILLGEDAAQCWDRQRQLAQQIKLLESEREEMRARVLHAIGDAAIAAMDGRDYDLTRSEVKGGPVSYERKSYFQVRERKARR